MDASDVVLIPFVACADAGSTIHDSDDEAAHLMGAAAATINIKPHIVGSGANARLLYGPCDIEIHRGVDRRLYVVDVARLLPPEPPGGALAAFLVHASTDSAAATTKHMTPIDLFVNRGRDRQGLVDSICFGGRRHVKCHAQPWASQHCYSRRNGIHAA